MDPPFRPTGRAWCFEHSNLEREIRLRKTAKLMERFGVRGRVLSIGGRDGAEVSGLRGVEEFLIVDLSPPPPNLPPNGYYLQEDVETAATKLEPESFDSIVMLEVIEHLPPDRLISILRSIRRLLKLGGILFLTTPNVARLRNILSLILRGRPAGSVWRLPEHPVPPFGHLREFGPAELRDMLRRAGYDVLHAGGFSVTHLMPLARGGVGVWRRVKYLILSPLAVVPEYLWAVASR